MKLLDVLKKVGSYVIRDAVPGGALALDIVNSFMPEGQKLPDTATGTQALAAVDSLPAESKLALAMKELDVEMAEINTWAQIEESLAKADMSGNSTRPDIAKSMSDIICFTLISFIAVWCIAILRGDTATLKEIKDSWEMLSAAVVFPMTIIRLYFGKRSDDKQFRYAVATGNTPSQGVIASVISALKGK